MKLEIKYLGVDELTPYENNTRKHGKEDVEEIKKSIEKYGFDDPIGIWGENNLIVEGHGRLMAAKELGMTEAPTIRLDHLTDEERREYAILHNRTAELSEWDFEKLKAEMAELHMEDFDFKIDGFDSELEQMEKEIIEDEIPEEILTRCQKGDLWQLGEHRLICGDSTEKATLEKLKEGKTAAEIIKTKEFAPESVYIVARKHFPDAISKTIRADTKAEKEDKAVAAVKDYLQEEPKVSEKILALERRMRAADDMDKILNALKVAKERLEDGKVIDVYKILDNIITHMEGTKA